MSAVGVGIIGAGVISDTYLQNLTSFPDVVVRSIADLDPARARAQAQRYGVPSAETTAHLLARDDIEIVVNLTVPRVHVDVGRQILAAGKHVWSEKPLGVDRESARSLLTAAQAAGLRVACAPDTVLGAAFQTARRALESGRIGRPVAALTQMLTPGPEKWHPSPDFLFQDGAGPLLDMGPYYLTALVSLFGPISHVSAAAQRTHAERTIGSGPRSGERFAVTTPTHVGALYGFASGAAAQAVFSFDSGIRRTSFEVTGTAGTVSIPDPNKFTGGTVVHVDDVAESLPAVGSEVGRGIGVVELAQAIREGRPERASGELALHVLDAALTTLEAAASGRTIALTTSVEPPPPLPMGWDPTVGVLND